DRQSYGKYIRAARRARRRRILQWPHRNAGSESRSSATAAGSPFVAGGNRTNARGQAKPLIDFTCGRRSLRRPCAEYAALRIARLLVTNGLTLIQFRFAFDFFARKTALSCDCNVLTVAFINSFRQTASRQ